MKKSLKSINKRKLTFLIAQKLNHQIHYEHIANVLSIFVEEFIDELQEKQRLDVPNFCSFRIEHTKPRKFHHIQKRRFAVSKGKPLLKIKLSNKLRIKIIQNLDLVKTFIVTET